MHSFVRAGRVSRQGHAHAGTIWLQCSLTPAARQLAPQPPAMFSCNIEPLQVFQGSDFHPSPETIQHMVITRVQFFHLLTIVYHLSGEFVGRAGPLFLPMTNRWLLLVALLACVPAHVCSAGKRALSQNPLLVPDSQALFEYELLPPGASERARGLAQSEAEK